MGENPSPLGEDFSICDSGNVTDEVIMQYIENQDIEDKDDDFKIST